MNIAVIGSGNVGGALGQAWVRAGHQVTFGVRAGSQGPAVAGAKTSPVAQAIREAEVVVLAVPWQAVPQVLAEAGDWSGKVIIDCTNPVAPGFELALGFTTSAGEQVASLAKRAKVVKAFNTTGADNMKNPVYGGKPLTMLFCTDDPSAKNIAERLIRDVAFEPVFAGPLKQARYLEPLAMLWITMSLQLQQGRDFAFNLVRRK